MKLYKITQEIIHVINTNIFPDLIKSKQVEDERILLCNNAWIVLSAAILRSKIWRCLLFLFSSLRFFAVRFVVLIIVITGGCLVRAHELFLPRSHPPCIPRCAPSRPPSAIDFGQANYIFSPAVEGIKLWYIQTVSRSPPAPNTASVDLRNPKNNPAQNS